MPFSLNERAIFKSLFFSNEFFIWEIREKSKGEDCDVLNTSDVISTLFQSLIRDTFLILKTN